MPHLNNSCFPKLLFSHRWLLVNVTSLFILIIFALFRLLLPSLPTITTSIQAQNVVPDNSLDPNTNLTAEQSLFTNFGAIRRTIHEIIIMAASTNNTMTRKIEFLEISNNFLRERLQRLLQMSEELRKILYGSNFFHIENSFDALNATLKIEDSKLFEENLEIYLLEVGNWLNKLTDTYGHIMKREMEKCSRKIKELEEKISRQIYETQHGQLCEMNTPVIYFSDFGKDNPSYSQNIGMGSILNRIETCVAAGIQSGSPCLIDDFHWEYDPRNLSKYYDGVKICPSALKRKRVKIYSVQIIGKYEKYVINVPLEVKASLEFCHEDPAAWYRGVILKHMLKLTTFSEQSIAQLLNDSKVWESKLDISEITSVHIRSPDVGRAVKFLQPREYFIALKYLCIVRKHLCYSNVTWVATDHNRNWVSFDSEMKKDDSFMNQFKTFSLNVSDVTGQATRYNPHSLLQFLADIRVLSQAKATIGALSTNLIQYAYNVRCADDPAASDRTLSLDFLHYPNIRKRRINFLLISPNFLFQSRSEPNFTTTISWPPKITINDGRVLTDFVQAYWDKPMSNAPMREGGLVKMLFVNRSVFGDPFYTPYFNLRRITETV